MATLVLFHAHPDDEAVATAGVMAQAAQRGHRVVLVLATRGERGEVPDGFLAPGELLSERRVAETEAAGKVLGVARIEYLGYEDSGMMGTPGNEAPESFWQADVEEAAGRLAAILDEERPDVFTIYDANGAYGHPDHIQVHRVGLRAAELAGVREVYEATINRDDVEQLVADAADLGIDLGEGEAVGVAPLEIGVPRGELTTRVDVEAYSDVKRASMRAHASQIAETSFFLALPDEAFRRAFGTEWFIHRGVPRPVAVLETELMP